MTTTTQNNEKAVPAVPLNIELRDYFAGRAMQEIIGFLPLMGLDEDKDQQVARRSYAIADAMLAERSKP